MHTLALSEPCPHTCSHLQVQFDGRDVDYTKNSDGYRSWVTAINLHFNNTQSAGVVSVGGKAVLTLVVPVRGWPGVAASWA